jgi:hypothetical protein
MVKKSHPAPAEDTTDVSDAETTDVTILDVDPDTVKAAKARKPSSHERDGEGKVLRKGKNLSGNVPFRTKLYQLVRSAPDAAIKAAPAQVQLILKHMAEDTDPATGAQIVQGAIDNGLLKTKIEPAVLFAYYRRLLETLGVEHVG